LTFINKILSDVDSKLNKGQVKKNPSIYHDNESPRIVEAGKFSSEIANLAYNKKLINLLKFFYEKKPLPISTINFIKGTEQPMHSDYMHFASTPEKFLAGAWIALEKTNRLRELSEEQEKNPFAVFALIKLSNGKIAATTRPNDKNESNKIEIVIGYYYYKKKQRVIVIQSVLFLY
jgi:hypothetical protein